MSTTVGPDEEDDRPVEHIFAGLAGLELDCEEYSLGGDVTLRKTYAHLMAPFLMAFAPAPPGKHHLAPWKAASGGLGYDVLAELRVPRHIGSERATYILRLLVALFRLWCSPSITIPVISNISFSAAAEAPDNAVQLIPLEVEPRYFPLEAPEGRLITIDRLEWVRDHWQSADFLMRENADFERAIHVLDQGQFMRFSDVALVSLWGAIELLFSPSPAELRFRVSALLAAYLEGAGEARLILQKEIVKLYDARSAAAHGRPDFDTNGLLDTFELLRRVIIKIINDGHVPSKDELESRLFGDSWEKVLN